MPRTTVYIVSDDVEVSENAKSYFSTQGVAVNVHSPQQWRDGLDNPFFRGQLVNGLPGQSSASGTTITGDNKGNVLPFPSASVPAADKVATMNELESKAIENAIAQFRGNLTEAAKALGIGRATLYRKVKQYNIDPSFARKKRAA
jgi:hypothetical protein